MTPSFDEILGLYDYDYPKELIANAPANPRDSAKLLVYDGKNDQTEHATFADILKFLPKNSVLVLNETKVIPARLIATRTSGGHVALLYLGQKNGLLEMMGNKKLKVGEVVTLAEGETLTVESDSDTHWLLRPSFPFDELPQILDREGKTPLPPYIKETPLDEAALRREYQTVFAKNTGSIAAPTASLHFTPELLRKIEEAGHSILKTTLHVHLGTFAPLTEEQLTTGRLHLEEYFIGEDSCRALEEAKKEGRPIIAVGTTVVRTVESAFNEKGECKRPAGTTDLFIREGYTFKMVNGLVTNSHVPKSSLLMLVSALTGRQKLLQLYKEAIDHTYRLFSFGDAMLIVP